TGPKLMAFAWDPDNTVQCQQLTIRAASPQSLVWSLDSRLKGFMGRWVDRTTGRIDLGQALELDCSTSETLPNGQIAPKRRADIGVIEQMLVSIRNASLPGQNASHWHF